MEPTAEEKVWMKCQEEFRRNKTESKCWQEYNRMNKESYARYETAISEGTPAA